MTKSLSSNILSLLFAAMLIAVTAFSFSARAGICEPDQMIESHEEMLLAANDQADEKGHAPAPPPLITKHKTKGVPIEDVDTQKDVPARTVFFELNPVEGASTYDIQVKALTEHWAAPYTTELEGTTLRLRLTPGQYKMRTRSKVAASQPGKWGPWKEFWVHFREPVGVFPNDGLTIVPKGSTDERVTFEWPVEKTAKFYLLSLYDKEGNILKRIRTQQTWMPLDLSQNRGYSWSVVPLATKDEPEPSVDKSYAFSVGQPNGELHGVKVEVEQRRHAVSYDFEFLKFVDDQKTGEPTIQHSKEPEFHAALSPGEYEMRARTNYDDDSHSNWGPPQKFWVRVANPQHLAPANNAKIDPTDDVEAHVKLKWKPAKEAKTYRVFVWDEHDKVVVDQATDSHSLALGLPHNQTYRWSVAALQDREKSRGPASETTAIPPDATSFTIEKYKRLDLNSAEEPSQFYAWGRYLTSNIGYKANNYDNNTSIQQTVFGGTGELAAGYWHRKTDFGLLAAASSSGFRTTGKTYTYNYGSLLLGYRGWTGPAGGRFRVWAGMGYKETPEILKNPDQDVYFSKIKAWTPEVRVAYLGEFNKKMGYELYASYLTAAKGIATVNDQPLKSLYQYNVGVYGTYRLSENIVGMAGYSYQVDSASYPSADPIAPGINQFSFSGHYLSLSLLMGLEKAMH